MSVYRAFAMGLLAVLLVGCAQVAPQAAAPGVAQNTPAAVPTPSATPSSAVKPIPDTASLDKAAVACGVTVAHTDGHGYYSMVSGGVAVASLLFSRTMDKNIDGLLTEASVDCFLGTFTPEVTVQALKSATNDSPYTKMWTSGDGSTWNVSGSATDVLGQVMVGWLY